MGKRLRIGTRESQLAVWQATKVQELLAQFHYESELVYIKSEGDIDLKTPLYEMGVQGIFTKSLDIALLNNTIDIAVHSMKDVPTQLAKGIVPAAVLERASYKDLLVYKKSVNGQWSIDDSQWAMVNGDPEKFEASFTIHHSLLTTHDSLLTTHDSPFTIATSSIRRKAQWLNRFPHHQLENLRGNVNTRLRKLEENNWHAAIFAAAGLERINLRPQNSIELEWMLPAPAQGAIMVVCREADDFCLEACNHFNDTNTAVCTQIERDFLRTLLGGCSTPISGLAQIHTDTVVFKGNILSINGKEKVEVEQTAPLTEAAGMGKKAAEYILANGGQKIADDIRNGQ